MNDQLVIDAGCRKPLAKGQWWSWCGETDMGQTMPALCTECGGSYKLKEQMMNDQLVIGDPDVIRKEDNILWLRAEVERLRDDANDLNRCLKSRGQEMLRLRAELKQANAVIERLETALTIMFTKANGILPDGAMCRAIAKAALAKLETDDG